MPGLKNVVLDALRRKPNHEVSRWAFSIRETLFKSFQKFCSEERFAAEPVGLLRYQKRCSTMQVLHQADNFDFEIGTSLWTTSGHRRIYNRNYSTPRTEMGKDFYESAHFHAAKTYTSVLGHAYWRGIYEAVTKYCLQSHTCQINKVPQSLPRGLLQSHDIPDTC